MRAASVPVLPSIVFSAKKHLRDYLLRELRDICSVNETARRGSALPTTAPSTLMSSRTPTLRKTLTLVIVIRAVILSTPSPLFHPSSSEKRPNAGLRNSQDCGLACHDEVARSVAGRGRGCRSDQEPSLTIRSVVGTQPVTNG